MPTDEKIHIAVLSDTHRRADMALFARRVPADLYLHLGDNASDAENLQRSTAAPAPVKWVRGNGDFFGPSSLLLQLGGVSLFITHGHRYGVKEDTLALEEEAVSHEAGVCLYGHTHEACLRFHRGIWFCNPGTLAGVRTLTGRTYALLTLCKGKAEPVICRWE